MMTTINQTNEGTSLPSTHVSTVPTASSLASTVPTDWDQSIITSSQMNVPPQHQIGILNVSQSLLAEIPFDHQSESTLAQPESNCNSSLTQNETIDPSPELETLSIKGILTALKKSSKGLFVSNVLDYGVKKLGQTEEQIKHLIAQDLQNEIIREIKWAGKPALRIVDNTSDNVITRDPFEDASTTHLPRITVPPL